MRELEDGIRRCILAGTGVVFRDPACTQPIAYNANATADCAAQRYAVDGQPAGFNRVRARVYERGAATSVAVAYTAGSGDCVLANGLPTDTQYYELGLDHGHHIGLRPRAGAVLHERRRVSNARRAVRS